ncbi:MAG: hypothetical protein IK095_05395 [Oscillospiraceae bacterium]|nr:hypothetical protein [Oscillospiraceae bacterium]
MVKWSCSARWDRTGLFVRGADGGAHLRVGAKEAEEMDDKSMRIANVRLLIGKLAQGIAILGVVGVTAYSLLLLVLFLI